jgi:hypothetical protein
VSTGPDPPDLRPPLPVGIHGIPRAREWDAVQSGVSTPFTGDELEFVVRPDGTPLIERDEPPGSYEGGWEPLAAPILAELAPPFRVRAVRRNGGYVVAARQIQAAPLMIAGDTLTFTVSEAGEELRVDDWPAVRGADELKRLVGDRFAEYVVSGRRLADGLWEVEVSPL